MKRNIGQHPSEQAEEQIRFIIRSLGLKANDRIPSERELSEMCALSRNTVRSATKFLISEGTLYTNPGKGNYLSPAPVILNPLDTASLTETAEKQGKRLRNEIIKARIAFPGEWESDAPEWDVSTKVFILKRTRYLDGAKYAFETSLLNCDRCEGIAEVDFRRRSLYRVMDSYGVRPMQGMETLQIVRAGEEEAQALDVAQGSPLLKICGTGRDREGTVLEYFYALIIPQKVRFVCDLERKRRKR